MDISDDSDKDEVSDGEISLDVKITNDNINSEKKPTGDKLLSDDEADMFNTKSNVKKP